MKTRILSAIVGLIILVCVLMAHKFVLTLAVFIISLIAINEYYKALSSAGYKPIKPFGYLSCLMIPIIGINNVKLPNDRVVDISFLRDYIPDMAFISLAILFFIVVITNNKYNIIDIALTIFGTLYIPFLFAFLPMTRNMKDGFIYIWFIFIGAWIPDTFAYFCGKFFGKHKFLPISPKKTVEGSIGGIIGSILAITAYGLIMQSHNYMDGINQIHFIILGVICGVISQLGDLAASSIKRFVGIKDYGKLMPGHGGALDRFDSILFIAPTVYLYLNHIIGI